MRQAISTKFLGPTNSRGARIKATCDAGSKVVKWDYSLNTKQNHEMAAHDLALSLGWLKDSALIGGSLPGAGYAFVLVPKWD